MSGGSFNHLCYAGAQQLLEKHRSDLTEMVRTLTEMGYMDAAQETESIILILNHFEVRMNARINRLSGVWKAVEWEVSGDSSHVEVEAAIAQYREDIEPDIEPGSI